MEEKERKKREERKRGEKKIYANVLMIDDGSELIRRVADAADAADVKEHRQFRPEGWMMTPP